jgi:hypothetical protein
MATYRDLENMAQNPEFQKQCKWALYIAANNVVNESAGTTNHAARLAFANKVLAGTQLLTDFQLARIVLLNATIQGELVSGPVDSDVQFQVNSVYDPQLIAIG